MSYKYILSLIAFTFFASTSALSQGYTIRSRCPERQTSTAPPCMVEGSTRLVATYHEDISLSVSSNINYVVTSGKINHGGQKLTVEVTWHLSKEVTGLYVDASFKDAELLVVSKGSTMAGTRVSYNAIMVSRSELSEASAFGQEGFPVGVTSHNFAARAFPVLDIPLCDNFEDGRASSILDLSFDLPRASTIRHDVADRITVPNPGAWAGIMYLRVSSY